MVFCTGGLYVWEEKIHDLCFSPSNDFNFVMVDTTMMNIRFFMVNVTVLGAANGIFSTVEQFFSSFSYDQEMSHSQKCHICQLKHRPCLIFKTMTQTQTEAKDTHVWHDETHRDVETFKSLTVGFKA